MSQHVEAQLLRAMASAKTLPEQAKLAAELDRVRRERAASIQADRDIDFADAVVRQTLAPARIHVFHTAATDWLSEEFETEDPTAVHTAMLAEASAWYSRVSSEVKADRAEFSEQAFGMARRVAGKHVDMDSARKSFLDYVAYLQSREAASGLDQIQQTTAPDGVTEKSTPLPTEVFDNFAPDVAPENQGKDEQVSSTHAPLLQEIMSDTSGSGTPEIPNGHSTGNTDTQHPNLVGGQDTHRDFTNTGSLQVEAGKCSNCTNGNHTGTNGTAGCKGGSCNCSCQKKEAKPRQDMEEKVGSIYSPSLALNYVANLDDYRREAEIRAQLEESPNFSLGHTANYDDFYGDYNRNQMADDIAGKHSCPACRGQGGTGADRMNNDGSYGQSCPTCHGSGMTDEGNSKMHEHHERYTGAKTAASGLDQIEQTVDPNNTPKTTPIPGEVMFPIVDNWNNDRPNQGGSGGQMAGDTSGEVNSAHTTGPTDAEFRGAPSVHTDLQDTGQAAYPSQPTPGSAGAEQPDGHHTTNADTEFKKVPSEHKNLAGLKMADMFGNSDMPHKIPNPDVANSPETTPQDSTGGRAAGEAAGRADGAKQDAPTFSDASSHARPYVQGYTDGYDEGFPDGKGEKDVPFSMHNMSNLHPDFEKGYNFASKWTTNSPLVATGSAEFEAGLYAGIKDSSHVEAWVASHRRNAVKYPYLASRLDRAKRVTAALKEAATSMDLDTHDPAGNVSANGDTPFNGTGSPPPLEGGTDPAKSGGPAPYNGADPKGHSIIPGANQSPHKPHPMQMQAPVKQDSGIAPLNPQTMAFRKVVQANMLFEANRKDPS